MLHLSIYKICCIICHLEAIETACRHQEMTFLHGGLKTAPTEEKRGQLPAVFTWHPMEMNKYTLLASFHKNYLALRTRELCVFFFFNRLIWVLRAKLYLLEKTNKRRSWEAAVAIGKPGGWGKRRRQCRVMRESRWLPRRSGNVQVGVGSRNGRTECIHGIPVVYTLTFLSVHSKVWQCHMCAEACLTSLTKL